EPGMANITCPRFRFSGSPAQSAANFPVTWQPFRSLWLQRLPSPAQAMSRAHHLATLLSTWALLEGPVLGWVLTPLASWQELAWAAARPAGQRFPDLSG